MCSKKNILAVSAIVVFLSLSSYFFWSNYKGKDHNVAIAKEEKVRHVNIESKANVAENVEPRDKVDKEVVTEKGPERERKYAQVVPKSVEITGLLKCLKKSNICLHEYLDDVELYEAMYPYCEIRILVGGGFNVYFKED